MKMMLTFFVAACLVLVGMGFYATWMVDEPAARLKTAKIKRGDLSCTISATGTVKLEQVEVGAQVTGQIAEFGSDPADPSKPLDSGSRVHEKMVLATIDQTIFKAQVERAEAATKKIKAYLKQSEAKRDQTEQEWKRAEELQPLQAIAESDYDLARTDFSMASSGVALWEAAVQESEAALRIAETNFGYTIIKSPCDGVIIDRRVNVGQTVVASFNAPGLFLIAKDSQQMQVWASVDEDDIRYIRPEMPVQFTVNARLDQLFKGKVAQIRLAPTRHGDDLSYTVVVATDRCDTLMSEMTANLQFEIERLPNVLLIPNDVLQWPTLLPETATEMSLTDLAEACSEQGPENALASEEEPIRTIETLGKDSQKNRRLWVKHGDLVRLIDVQIGATNGLVTEITGDDVKEGMEVVWGELCMEGNR